MDCDWNDLGRFWLAWSATPMDDGFNDDIASNARTRAHNCHVIHVCYGHEDLGDDVVIPFGVLSCCANGKNSHPRDLASATAPSPTRRTAHNQRKSSCVNCRSCHKTRSCRAYPVYKAAREEASRLRFCLVLDSARIQGEHNRDSGGAASSLVTPAAPVKKSIGRPADVSKAGVEVRQQALRWPTTVRIEDVLELHSGSSYLFNRIDPFG